MHELEVITHSGPIILMAKTRKQLYAAFRRFVSPMKPEVKMNKLKTLTVNNGTNNKPIGTIAIINLPKSWRKTLEEGGKVYLFTYPNHTEAHFRRLQAWSPSWKTHRSTEMLEFVSSDSLALVDEPDETDIPPISEVKKLPFTRMSTAKDNREVL